MLLQDLEKRELIKPPTWLTSNTCYLTRMGSVAYGVSSDNYLDISPQKATTMGNLSVYRK